MIVCKISVGILRVIGKIMFFNRFFPNFQGYSKNISCAKYQTFFLVILTVKLNKAFD